MTRIVITEAAAAAQASKKSCSHYCVPQAWRAHKSYESKTAESYSAAVPPSLEGLRVWTVKSVGFRAEKIRCLSFPIQEHVPTVSRMSGAVGRQMAGPSGVTIVCCSGCLFISSMTLAGTICVIISGPPLKEPNESTQCA
ncbi:hypothetical protein HPB50_001313 [Hyalomma asiaticum]|uniref:Uncharacterized protein n=1 Tax=Hyalomma asiaticum TaxID=266040 RepID=A0ACB7T7L1_HYAAI|nr:hypothetical protein HPB50_001313 [Hyalomma asiaticum]